MKKYDNWPKKKEFLIREISKLIRDQVPFIEGQLIIAEGVLEEIK